MEEEMEMEFLRMKQDGRWKTGATLPHYVRRIKVSENAVAKLHSAMNNQDPQNNQDPEEV